MTWLWEGKSLDKANLGVIVHTDSVFGAPAPHALDQILFG